MLEIGSAPVAQEPIRELCRTIPLGVTIPGTDQELSYCSLENMECRYAKPFGYDCICLHPDHLTFKVTPQNGAKTATAPCRARRVK